MIFFKFFSTTWRNKWIGEIKWFAFVMINNIYMRGAEALFTFFAKFHFFDQKWVSSHPLTQHFFNFFGGFLFLLKPYFKGLPLFFAGAEVDEFSPSSWMWSSTFPVGGLFFYPFSRPFYRRHRCTLHAQL